jgi:hypothetical protein
MHQRGHSHWYALGAFFLAFKLQVQYLYSDEAIKMPLKRSSLRALEAELIGMPLIYQISGIFVLYLLRSETLAYL